MGLTSPRLRFLCVVPAVPYTIYCAVACVAVRVVFETYSRRFWRGCLCDRLPLHSSRYSVVTLVVIPVVIPVLIPVLIPVIIPIVIPAVQYGPSLWTLCCSKLLSIIATGAVSEVKKNNEVTSYFACLKCISDFLVPASVDIHSKQPYDSWLPALSSFSSFSLVFLHADMMFRWR